MKLANHPRFIKLIALASLILTQGSTFASEATLQEENAAVVRASFERWTQGTGSPFELLTPDTDWTIVGSSPLSKTYHDRNAFYNEVLLPFNARISSKMKPTVKGIYADGDTVVALFDADATGSDGLPYHNTYTWYFSMKDKRVTHVISFFDTRDFDAFWSRVAPGTFERW